MREKVESRKFSVSYQGKEFELSARTTNTGSEFIVFLHGLGCSKESFDEAYGFSGLAGFRLLAVDLVGYGESSRPPDFSYSMEEQAEILRLLLDEMNPAKVHIVAHSMGGAVGLLLAKEIEDRLGSFVNVEGNLIGSDCGLISRKAISIPYGEFRDGMFGKVTTRGPMLWREMSAKSDPWGFYKSSESLVEWSDSEKLLEIFAGLKTSKVYVYGDQNSDMEILQRLGAIEKVAIPESGHFVMNDNPREFYTLVNRLLRK
jgi:pimeloyl-ACP methyl ester carboxylesterase